MERILCQYSSNKSSVLQINTICFAKKNSTSKQTQSDLQIQNCIWEKMQRYGQIYVLCVTTVRLICLFMRKLGLIFSQMRAGWFSHKCVQADFLTNACWQIFSQMRAGRFSHKCVQADFLTNACWQIFSQMRAGWFSHKCVLADFLTNACRQIFSQMRAGWFSHKCVLADFLTNACRQIFSQMRAGWFSHTSNWATFFSKNSRWRCLSIYASLPRPETPLYLSDQYEWGTGEFLCLTISILTI